MTAFRRLALVVVALLLLALAGAAWYFFGSNGRPAAELVPGDTLAFALIANGAGVGADYETSKLRQLVEAPEAQPLLDSITRLIGDKNLALLHVLGPDLSGQSFIALTHFDPDHPAEAGFIAGMRPKFGADHFDEFVQQVNTSYPDLAHETKTGHDTLLGVDYQWIEGNSAPGRVCVARYRGWIVTTWGEAALQDWLERMQGKPATPSLAENADFTKSRDRVGTSQGLVYLDYPRLFSLLAPRLGALSPALVDNLKRRFGSMGGAAVGTSFQNGEIVDRFSLLEPKQAQLDNGLAPQPCPFETLKFTGPDTRFYFGASLNWPQVWKNLQEQLADNGPAAGLVNQLTALAQAGNIDVEKNIIDALGPEYSVQLEWAGRRALSRSRHLLQGRQAGRLQARGRRADRADAPRIRHHRRDQRDGGRRAPFRDAQDGAADAREPDHHRGRPLLRFLPQRDARRARPGARRDARPAAQRRLQPPGRQPARRRHGPAHLPRYAASCSTRPTAPRSPTWPWAR